ncbi:MAG TPA: VWA domain-containing protein [Bryobacteraceae bacterium]|nr:VWA domain-containing protein [Bryobacteraceae bacterium]
MKRLLIAALLLLLPLSAQEDATFSAGVKVVSVLATVLGPKGELVRNLEQNDFQILENGRPQPIRYFSRDSDLPLTIGLLVDTSMSQAGVIEAERAASFRFLDAVLREDRDQVFITQFDASILVAQPLTASREKLERALRLVDTPSRSELRMGIGIGTALYDAVVQSSRDIMAKQTGRKALIIMSDGGENRSDSTMADAIDAAQKSGTLVYSVLFGGTMGRGILKRLSAETGGGFFEVTSKLPINDVFARIQEELRGQYNLGYVSDTPVRISEFRKLQVTVKTKGMKVQARDRYWAAR